MGTKSAGGGGEHEENKIFLRVNECFQSEVKSNTVFTNTFRLEKDYGSLLLGEVIILYCIADLFKPNCSFILYSRNITDKI